MLPLGAEATAAAYAAFAAIKHKVDDYFARCRLVAFDARAAAALNRREEEYLDVAAQDLTITVEEVAGFPLAQVAAGPAAAARGTGEPGARRRAGGAARRGGRAAARRARAAHRGGLDGDRRQAGAARRLAGGEGRRRGRIARRGARRASCSPPARRPRLDDLLAQDRALEAEAASIENMERLVRYNRDLALPLHELRQLQGLLLGGEPAVFQCGTLYLDQRACRLCLRVDDAAKHATMAGLAGAYLAYLDCVRKSSDEKMTVVAVFTAGDCDNLMIGRNGVFYDRQGERLGRDDHEDHRQPDQHPPGVLVALQEVRAPDRGAGGEARRRSTTRSRTRCSRTRPRRPSTSTAPRPPRRRRWTWARWRRSASPSARSGRSSRRSSATAPASSSSGRSPSSARSSASWPSSRLPSVVLAWLKLRARNLGPILDANGWAVNAKAKLNIPFGATLTSVAKLPPGSKRDNRDPYAEKAFPWKRILLVAAVLTSGYHWYRGTFDRYLPETFRASSVFGWPPSDAPAKK